MAFGSSGSGSGYATTGWSPPTQSYAISVWLKTTQTTLNAIPFGKCNSATQGGPSIVFNNPVAGKYLLYAKEGGGEPIKIASTSTGVFNDGNWHNFIINYNGINGVLNQVFLDGVLDASTTATSNVTPSGSHITMGRSEDSFWNGFVGQHAYLAAWDRNLTADEIESIGVARINPGLIARDKLRFLVPSFQALRQLWTPGGFDGTIGVPTNHKQPPVRGAAGHH
jgi:hypothetical protein